MMSVADQDSAATEQDLVANVVETPIVLTDATVSRSIDKHITVHCNGMYCRNCI